MIELIFLLAFFVLAGIAHAWRVVSERMYVDPFPPTHARNITMTEANWRAVGDDFDWFHQQEKENGNG